MVRMVCLEKIAQHQNSELLLFEDEITYWSMDVFYFFRCTMQEKNLCLYPDCQTVPRNRPKLRRNSARLLRS